MRAKSGAIKDRHRWGNKRKYQIIRRNESSVRLRMIVDDQSIYYMKKKKTFLAESWENRSNFIEK